MFSIHTGSVVVFEIADYPRSIGCKILVVLAGRKTILQLSEQGQSLE